MIEEQLGLIFQLARKHRVNADQLSDTLAALDAELQGLKDGGESIETLQQQLAELAVAL